MPITDFAREHVKKLDAGMTKMCIGNCVFAECNQIRFDPNLACQRMPEEVIQMAALVPRRSIRTPVPALTKEQSRRSSVSAKRRLIGR